MRSDSLNFRFPPTPCRRANGWSRPARRRDRSPRRFSPAHKAPMKAVKGFELGKFSFLEALDAQRTLLEAAGAARDGRGASRPRRTGSHPGKR